jgi:dimeric dUTPase (all-alpha-NTP-PPase superfamily)
MSLQGMLDNQLNMQMEIRATIGLKPQDEMTMEERCRLVDDFATHLMVEAGEFLKELPYFKFWKVYEDHGSFEDYPNCHELRIEFIDIFLFWLNMANLLGLNGTDLENLYYSKASEVLERERRRHLEERPKIAKEGPGL